MSQSKPVAPNTRVQRTRSSASPPHSPLTRSPLGAMIVIVALVFVTTSPDVARAGTGDQPAVPPGAFEKYAARHPSARQIGGSVTAPVTVSRARPEFPDKLAKKKRELSPIIVAIIVSRDGSVIDPVVVSTANADLHPYVLEAARQFRYQPARENGQPVEVIMVLTFLLHGDGR